MHKMTLNDSQVYHMAERVDKNVILILLVIVHHRRRITQPRNEGKCDGQSCILTFLC